MRSLVSMHEGDLVSHMQALIDDCGADALIEIRSRLAIYDRMKAAFDHALKTRLKASGGGLDSSQGMRIELRTENGTPHTDAAAARHVIGEYLPDVPFSELVKLDLTKCKEVDADRAPARTKTQRVRQFVADLQDAGALTPQTREVVRVVKTTQEIEQ